MAPLVTIVLPVYNQAPFLAQTLKSVLAQSYADFELLVHDDGSTDASAALIRQFAARDPRVRASYGPNAGRSAATNALAARARGQWLVFLDADDVMLPRRLERQLAHHLAHPGLDASSCHCHYIDARGRHLGTQRYPGLRTPEEGQQMLAANEFVMCAITGLMIRKIVFEQSGGFRPAFWPCEDHDFFNRLLEQGYSLVILPEPLMLYRVHPTAITVRQPLHVFDVLDYSTHCTGQRRSGQPEPAFADFMATRQRQPWWVRLNRQRRHYAVMLHRQAGFSLRVREYGRFSWHLATAWLLSPSWVFAALRKGLSERRLASAPTAISAL